MKVAEISPYSLSVPGGVQGQVISLAHALRDLGHEVEILAPCDEPTMAEDLINLGSSRKWYANGSIAPVAIGMGMQSAVRSALRDGGFDVIHLHEPLTPFVGVASLRYAHARVVGTFHRSGASLAYRAYGHLLLPLRSKIDVAVAVSPEAADTARRVCGVHCQVLGNGVETSRFSGAEPWRKDGPVVMFIGRHEHRKGLGVLLEAFDDSFDDVELWVAGDGPETLALHQRYRGNSRIKWLGRVSDAEAASRMKAADIVCAPSLYGESFGVVLLEAMAAGAVVVASDIPGYRDLMRDGVDGVLVPPGESEALRVALRTALDSPEKRESLRSAGLESADRYSTVRLAKSYIDLFTGGAG